MTAPFPHGNSLHGMTTDLTAARALADAADKAADGATEGPWYPQDFTSPEVNDDPIARDVHVSCTWPDHISVASMGGGFHGFEDLEQARLDARFIAASRQLVPDMAATIRALADEVERLRAIMAVADQTIWAMDALQEQPYD